MTRLFDLNITLFTTKTLSSSSTTTIALCAKSNLELYVGTDTLVLALCSTQAFPSFISPFTLTFYVRPYLLLPGECFSYFVCGLLMPSSTRSPFSSHLPPFGFVLGRTISMAYGAGGS